MASPQWKNFQPSAQDPVMPSCQRSPSFNKTSNDDCLRNSNNSSPGGASRETGIVEKLLHSYGFIQCCERQARLFFHYSQYSGTIEHLKLGDAVEFEMTYDRRTGKPIASSVCKISSEVGEVMCEERVSGFITTEVKANTEGRVAYENRGECFFLPYGVNDIEGSTELRPQDKVTFRIATDNNTGNLRARSICLEKPVAVRYQGVICALKETFGFIERADVVKEIFFHSSECKDFRNLNLGDDVDFSIQSIQTRNGKEVAVNVVTLPLGTVIFDDVNSELLFGEVTEELEKGRNRSSDSMQGKIQCNMGDKVVYYPFGERDPKVDYTLQVGDWVQFNIATDRRDSLERATNIELLDNEFNFPKEKREQGIVAQLKDTYGFITYGQRVNRLYFRLSELFNPEETLKIQDEVEFSIAEDPSTPGRSQAIRIKLLPPGTIPEISNGSKSDDFNCTGTVEKEAYCRWSSAESPQSKRASQEENGEEGSDGVIIWNKNGVKERIYFTSSDCESRSYPHCGDKVEFVPVFKEDRQYATHVKVLPKAPRNGFRYGHRGFIAALKDSFGFIETEEHDKEVFFHYSTFDGNTFSLKIGQEVEYGVTYKGNKLSAECVRKLPSNTIPKEEVRPEVLNGVVVQPLRCFNPDQDQYAGKVRLASHAENMDENLPEYEFGITSLEAKQDFLQKGDVVQFQIGITSKGKERALNIKAIRTRIQATVDTLKGNFGFLNYEAEEGKKLFFHMSEVKDEESLRPGDQVEFIVVHHQRTGKYSACSVVKIGEGTPKQRPERLNRLRTISTEGGGPRIIVVRQPKGPDGSTGFTMLRSLKEVSTNDENTNLLNSVEDRIKDSCSGINELHLNNVEPNTIVCSQG